MSGENRMSLPYGVEGNYWNNVLTGTAAPEAGDGIEVFSMPFVTVFGTLDGAATITVYVSADNINFYASQSTQAATTDFCINLTTGARFIALKSSANRTATGTIMAKG